MQVASQALIGPALVIANGFSIPFTRRAALRQQAGRSDVKVLLAWASVLVVCMGAASLASTLATGLFVRFFGSAWYSAEPLVPALAVQAIIFVGSQIAMTRYRSLLRPALLRRFWLVPSRRGLRLDPPRGPDPWGRMPWMAAIWASNGLMALLAGGALTTFERQAHGRPFRRARETCSRGHPTTDPLPFQPLAESAIDVQSQAVSATSDRREGHLRVPDRASGPVKAITLYRRRWR